MKQQLWGALGGAVLITLAGGPALAHGGHEFAALAGLAGILGGQTGGAAVAALGAALYAAGAIWAARQRDINTRARLMRFGGGALAALGLAVTVGL